MASAGAGFWVATQSVLQAAADPLVDKPKLTDKLLAKPPFRFLHDVITAVQTKTGFAPGLFAAQELDAHAIQDKEGKVAYLIKIIAVVSLALNEAVPAKPLKIVAGLEPEHTNTFLQMLGRAARMGPAADAVQRVLADQPGTPAAAQPSTGSTNTAQPNQAPHMDKSGSGSRHTYTKAAGAGAGSAAAQGQAVTTQQQQQQQQQPSAASAMERPHSSRRLSRDVSGKQQQQQLEEQQAPQQSPPAAPVHSSAGAHRNSPRPAAVELPRPGSSGSSRVMFAMKAAPTLASPSSSPVRAHSPQQVSQGAPPASGLRSAGRAPPGAPDAQSQLARPPSAGLGRPGSSSSSHRRDTGDGFANILKKDGVGARSGRNRPSPLLGGAVCSDDEDAPVQDLLAGDPLTGLSMVAQGVDTAAAGAQGVLVKDILSAEQELRRAGADAAAGAGDQGDGGTGIILKRQAKPTGRDVSRRKPSDLASLADSVQKLCQVALPLARSLEFLHEDVDSMSKEYRFWVTERRVFQERLQEEQKAAADTCDLAATVAEQDTAIRGARARILALRSQVLQGEQQINKVLNTLVNPPR